MTRAHATQRPTPLGPVRSAPANTIDRRLFLALPIAIMAVQLVWGGVDLLLAAALDRVEGGADVTTYGWITGIASLCALLVFPLAGSASDRTPLRFGRRSAWVAVGAAGSTIGLLALGQAQDVGALGVTYVIAFAFLPVVLVPVYASIPDRVSVGRRGAIGAVVGGATILGGVAGNVVAARFADRIEVGVVVFAAVLISGAAVFVLVGRESRGPKAPMAAEDHGAQDRGEMDRGEMDDSASHRRVDFVWFSVGRFALFLGYASIAGLAYYVVRDHVGQDDPASGVAAFAVVTGVTTLLASVVAGLWSDRVRRRKPFVMAASLILGLGLLVPVVSSTFGAFLVAAAIIGIGFGTYLSVGTALGTLVLPNALSSGRDLGVIGFANASAQAVAPVVGSYLAFELGYPVMFSMAALACLVAAAAVLPIKSVT
jgi:MFS family permease